MSGLVDTCPPAALGVTFGTLELSGGSDHAVGLETTYGERGAVGRCCPAQRGGDLQIQIRREPWLGTSRSTQTPGINICQSTEGRGDIFQSEQLG